MGFFSDPYGQEQLREGVANNPKMEAIKQRTLQEAAANHHTGTIAFPGESYKFENGNIVAHNNGGGWKKFIVTAAALVGGGILAGGGLAAGAAPTGGATTTGSEAATLSTPEVASGGATAAEAATSGVLPSTITAPTTGALVEGGTGLAGVETGVGSGVLSQVGNILKRFGTKDVLGGAADAVSNATQAATTNRHSQAEEDRLGRQAYENEFINRSKQEQSERDNAEKDSYRASWYQNRQSGPYNPKPPVALSPNFQTNLSNLEQAAMTTLANPAKYSTAAMPTLDPYAPTQPSTGEKIGTYAGPILKIASLFGRR